MLFINMIIILLNNYDFIIICCKHLVFYIYLKEYILHIDIIENLSIVNNLNII